MSSTTAKKKFGNARKKNPADKRRAPRTDHDSVIELHDGEGRLIRAIGRMVNFSAVGLCFSSRQPLELGEKIHAELRLLKEGRMNISGRIIWMKKQQAGCLYGVEFDSICPIRA